MRVRHRWLWLSFSVAAILTTLTILCSKPTDRSYVTVTFWGYTNLPDAKARSAVFVATQDSLATINTGDYWVDAEEPAGHKANTIEPSFYITAVPRSEGGHPWSLGFDEPPESGRRRLSWRVYHSGLAGRLGVLVARYRLLPRWWLDSPLAYHYVTNHSIWLTNPPSDNTKP
jgi:hypothetical protein